MSPRLPARGDDRGTMIPLLLGFFLVALLLTVGVTAASKAFLAQRDLQAQCDGAALSAADALDEGGTYRHADSDRLRLSGPGVDAAIASYFAVGGGAVDYSSDTDGTRVVLTCRTVAELPFGATFGYPEGLPRTATSSADAPLR